MVDELEQDPPSEQVQENVARAPDVAAAADRAPMAAVLPLTYDELRALDKAWLRQEMAGQPDPDHAGGQGR